MSEDNQDFDHAQFYLTEIAPLMEPIRKLLKDKDLPYLMAVMPKVEGTKMLIDVDGNYRDGLWSSTLSEALLVMYPDSAKKKYKASGHLPPDEILGLSLEQATEKLNEIKNKDE